MQFGQLKSHHAARQRSGGVAARGARAAGGDADHRIFGREHASSPE
jgi:hypothetical protein